MSSFRHLAPEECNSWTNAGWYEIELAGIERVDWAELWLDLGLGYIRYHSIPLDVTEKGSLVALARLHRKPRAAAIRLHCVSPPGEHAVALKLRMRRVSIATAVIRWIMTWQGCLRAGLPFPAFPLSGLQILAPASKAKSAFDRSHRAEGWRLAAHRGASSRRATDSGSSRCIVELSPVLLGSGAGSLFFAETKVRGGPNLQAGAENALTFKVGDAQVLNALAQDDQEAWILIVDSGAKVDAGSLTQLVNQLGSDSDAVAYFGDRQWSSKDLPAGAIGLRGQFCPHRLLSGEATGPLMAIKASAAIEAGGWQVEDGEDALFGLTLRLFERFGRQGFRHVPLTLARDVECRGHSSVARSLCESSLERLNLPVTAYYPGEYRKSGNPSSVTVIIPTRDRLSLLRKAVESIRRSCLEIRLQTIIVDNGSTDAETVAWLANEVRTRSDLLVLREPGPFNFSRLNNFASQFATGEVLAFINNDIEIESRDLLPICAEQALHSSVGAVGPLLVYPGGLIQNAGVLTGPGGVAGHPLAGRHPDSCRTDAFPMITRSVSAITAACLFVSREKFASVKGFDDDLAIAFNDVDLCLKLERAGWNNVLIPSLRAVHLESQSRKPDRHYDQEPRLRAEFEIMRSRWGDRLDWDPWISNAIRVDKGMPSPFWGRHPCGLESP